MKGKVSGNFIIIFLLAVAYVGFLIWNYYPKLVQTYQERPLRGYNIHHIKPVEDGGDVCNLDNLSILAPKLMTKSMKKLTQLRVAHVKYINKYIIQGGSHV